MLSKVRELCRKYWKFAAGAFLVLILILVALTQVSQGPNLAKYQALAARGEVETCRAELAKTLRKHPNWHEGRALLAQLDMEGKEFAAATNHLIILAKAGWDTKSLENTLTMLATSVPLAELEKAFDPDWHWPRTLFVEIALKNNHYIKAIPVMAFLNAAGQDVAKYEATLVLSVPSNSLTDYSGFFQALASETLWHSQLSLRLAQALGDTDQALVDFVRVHSLSPDSSILELVHTSFISEDLVTAWRMAEIYNRNHDKIVHKLYLLNPQELKTMLEGLREFEHPELAILRASLLDKPIPALLNLEKYHTPYHGDLYGALKLAALYKSNTNLTAEMAKFITVPVIRDFAEADPERALFCLEVLALLGKAEGTDLAALASLETALINPLVTYVLSEPTILPSRILNMLSPQVLYALAVEWRERSDFGADTEVKHIALHLEGQLEPGPRYASYLRLMLGEGKAITHESDISFSPALPDGAYIIGAWLAPNKRYLVYHTGNFHDDTPPIMQYVIDLEQNHPMDLPGNPDEIFWSPDSSLLALVYPNTIDIYRYADLALVTNLTRPNNTRILGWQDDNDSLLWSSGTTPTRANSYSVSSGQTTSWQSTTPLLSPAGKLALVRINGQQITVTIDNIISTYTDSIGVSTATHFRDDGQLVFSLGDKQSIAVLSLVTGNLSVTEIPLGFSPTHVWADSNSLYCSMQTHILFGSFVLLDIRDLSIDNTVFHLSEFTILTPRNFYSLGPDLEICFIGE